MANYLGTPVGVHRLMRAPYDDREVFASVSDLLTYCSSGARYNGQKVAVTFPTYVQNYTISIYNNVAYPIIELPNGFEWHKATISTFVTPADYLLIYYDNTTENWANIDKFNRIYNPDKWSFMDSVSCMLLSTNWGSNFGCVIRIKDGASIPTLQTSTGKTLTRSGNTFSTGDASYPTLFPANKTANQQKVTMEVYVKCPNYISAMGVLING